MKNLYLPGTNKNVGYILGNTMHIYKKYIKYFPIDTTKSYKNFGLSSATKKFIVKAESDVHLELEHYIGWYYEVEDKMYTFFDCTFQTPDNLDVVEIAYLYKHWSIKKNA